MSEALRGGSALQTLRRRLRVKHAAEETLIRLYRTRYFGLVRINEDWTSVRADRAFVDNDLDHVVERRQIEHRIEQRLLEYGAQAARTGFAFERFARNGFQRRIAHFEFDAFHRKHF